MVLIRALKCFLGSSLSKIDSFNGRPSRLLVGAELLEYCLISTSKALGDYCESIEKLLMDIRVNVADHLMVAQIIADPESHAA